MATTNSFDWAAVHTTLDKYKKDFLALEAKFVSETKKLESQAGPEFQKLALQFKADAEALNEQVVKDLKLVETKVEDIVSKFKGGKTSKKTVVNESQGLVQHRAGEQPVRAAYANKSAEEQYQLENKNEHPPEDDKRNPFPLTHKEDASHVGDKEQPAYSKEPQV